MDKTNLVDLPELSSSHWEFEVEALAADFIKFEVNATADNATITIFDQIGGDGGVTPNRVAAALRSIGPKPVTVEVNSPGGNYFDGVAIYNLLRRHSEAVTVQVLGIAASAASIIAMAGDRIEIAHNAEIMIHQARGIFMGTADDVLDAAAVLQKLDGAMADLYASRTGIDRGQIVSMMKAETFIGGQQAVEQNFADAVMEREAQQPVLANADLPEDISALDKFLAKQGMTRSKRRALFREMKGDKPSAAPQATHDAGWADEAAALIAALKN